MDSLFKLWEDIYKIKKKYKCFDFNFKYNEKEWKKALSLINNLKYKNEFISFKRSEDENKIIKKIRREEYGDLKEINLIINNTKLFILLAYNFDNNNYFSLLPIELIEKIFYFITKESIIEMDWDEKFIFNKKQK